MATKQSSRAMGEFIRSWRRWVKYAGRHGKIVLHAIGKKNMAVEYVLIGVIHGSQDKVGKRRFRLDGARHVTGRIYANTGRVPPRWATDSHYLEVV